MSDPYAAGYDSRPLDDEPSRRFGQFMAIVFGAQFVAGLLGVGGRISFQVLHPLLFAASLAIRNGSSWGRAVLTWFFAVFMGLAVVFALFIGKPVAFAILIPVLGLLFLHLVAAAFTLERLPPAFGFPERWRPWATSSALHVVLLVLGLLGALGGGYSAPRNSSDI